MSNKPFVISLVGRPNVGKSSLFNRLMKKANLAMTHDRPGVTRDRHYGFTKLDETDSLEEKEIILVDTGGFYPKSLASDSDRPDYKPQTYHKKIIDESIFLDVISDQALKAVSESDLVLLVVDGREGLTPYDELLGHQIRKMKKDFWVVVNKIDSTKQEGLQYDFYNIGVAEEELFSISATHGSGLLDFRRKLQDYVAKKQDLLDKGPKGVVPKEEVIANLAIIGAPNSGKSTLLNRLLKAERALVSNVPGTTVDPVEGYFDLYLGEEFEKILRQSQQKENKADESSSDLLESELPVDEVVESSTEIEIETEIKAETEEEGPTEELDKEVTNRWRSVRIIDTAGIRRQKSVRGDIETQSVYRSLKAISSSDIILLVVDATKGISHQDKRLCDIILEKGKSLIILLNKIDLVKRKIKDHKMWKEWLEEVGYSIPWKFCSFVPLSALEGNNIRGLKKSICETIHSKISKISTPKLNQCFQELTERKQVVVKNEGRSRRLKVKYASVVKMTPPTFLIFANASKNIPQNYRRYLINGIRKYFELPNTPIHLVFRTGRDGDKNRKREKLS